MKLAARFQRASIVREFAKARRSGFYCSVLLEGEFAAGDPIAWAGRSSGMPSVAAPL